ncbi:hypothetical protein GY45DRAFT_1328900 [Cubamyces sp. BRFM 1775]|nr:hypothetical protein GY45DRAFT_1328900 [Cubamyces sp. BRFM 1775]
MPHDHRQAAQNHTPASYPLRDLERSNTCYTVSSERTLVDRPSVRPPVPNHGDHTPVVQRRSALSVVLRTMLWMPLIMAQACLFLVGFGKLTVVLGTIILGLSQEPQAVSENKFHQILIGSLILGTATGFVIWLVWVLFCVASNGYPGRHSTTAKLVFYTGSACLCAVQLFAVQAVGFLAMRNWTLHHSHIDLLTNCISPDASAAPGQLQSFCPPDTVHGMLVTGASGMGVVLFVFLVLFCGSLCAESMAQ